MNNSRYYLLFVLLLMISPFSLDADSREEAQQLRVEIARQELILKALKERLATIEKNYQNRPISIYITKSGSINYRGSEISKEALATELNTFPKDAEVRINVFEDTPLEYPIVVLELCAAAGLTDTKLVNVKSRMTRPIEESTQ